MAGKKTRKCQWCKVDGTLMADMEFEMVGITKPIQKFYHKHCWQERLKEKEFQAKEQLEKDELNEVLKKIYGVPSLPSEAWNFLEKIRGGNPVFSNQQMGKRYKEGYSYPLIKETFEYCSDTIEYWNSVKSFDGFKSAFRYALKIVIDKLYIVEQRVKEREKQKILVEKHMENLEDNNQEFESTYKKPSKTNTDISDFLDD